jgi:ABC-type Fe3+/spermidine/putrescine transport system ATPase subunit
VGAVQGGAVSELLRIEGLRKGFGGTAALEGVDLAIAEGERFALLGASGCGKSTLLRCLAGLETPEAGRILLDGEDITALPPHRRPVNLMFQSYALFPHMDVARNIGFGLEQAGLSKAAIARRVEAMLALVRLEGLGGRRPAQLSGGQRARVALARALARAPRLLLLDEPLSALDRNLREAMQAELAAIQQAARTTFILVTHDQAEALSLATRMAVMRAGRIAQEGPPATLYERPASRYVAEFLGAANVLDGGPLGLPGLVAIRPERIALRADGAHPGTLREAAYRGQDFLLSVALDAGPVLRVVLPNAGAAPPAAGARVALDWPADAVVALPR